MASMMMMVRRPILIAASIVTLLATACSSGRGAPPRTTATTAAAIAHFSGRPVPVGLAFDHPAAWRAQWWDYHSSFTSLITYLSPLTLHDPCVRTSISTSCGQPLASLPAGGVLVTWQNVGIPRPLGAPEIENPNTTIGGQPSRVTTARPGDCSLVDADETVTADITRPGGNHFEMIACLRQPGIASDEALIHLMLASVRVTP